MIRIAAILVLFVGSLSAQVYQPVYELACVAGQTPLSNAQTLNPKTGKLRANICIDNSGNYIINTGTPGTAGGLCSNASNQLIACRLSKQDLVANGSATTGTGASQTVYTYSLPSGTLAAGACLGIESAFRHVTGSASITSVLAFGSTTLLTSSFTSVSEGSQRVTVCNKAASTTSQWATALGTNSSSSTGLSDTAPAENTNSGSSIVIALSVTVANTDTWAGKGFRVFLIP